MGGCGYVCVVSVWVVCGCISIGMYVSIFAGRLYVAVCVVCVISSYMYVWVCMY